MSDIFLSYSDLDKERVIPIVRFLEKQNWSVWWDKKIPPGKAFDQVIEEAIDAAKCVLVVWSKASIESDWVKTEASEGVQRGIMIPVIIDDVKIPFEFRRVQAAKLTSFTEDSSITQELLRSISDLIERPVSDSSAKLTVPTSNASNKRGLRNNYRWSIKNFIFSILIIALIAWIIYAPSIHGDYPGINIFIILVLTVIIYLAFPIRPSFAILSSFGIQILNIWILFSSGSSSRHFDFSGMLLIYFIPLINAVLIGFICRWRIAQGDSTSRTTVLSSTRLWLEKLAVTQIMVIWLAFIVTLGGSRYAYQLREAGSSGSQLGFFCLLLAVAWGISAVIGVYVGNVARKEKLPQGVLFGWVLSPILLIVYLIYYLFASSWYTDGPKFSYPYYALLKNSMIWEAPLVLIMTALGVWLIAYLTPKNNDANLTK